MSIQKLIETAKNRVITENEIVELNWRLKEREEQFEQEARERAIDNKWLERRYTI